MHIQKLLINPYAIPGLKNRKKLTNKFRTSFQYKDIEDAVCKYFNLTPEQFYNTSRKREIVYPKQVFMYMCIKHTRLNLELIGNAFPSKRSISGCMDRHAVLHARNTIQDLCATDELIKDEIKEISDLILQGFGRKTIKDVINGVS